MDFLVDQLRFLGLNEREIKTFTTLATFGQLTMTMLASRAKLPRTTVDAIVRRLAEQGLIKRVQVKKHSEYFVELEAIADKLDWLEQRLRGDSASSIENRTTLESQAVSHNNDEEIVNYSKTPEQIVEGVFASNVGDRVRALVARGATDHVAVDTHTIGRIIEYVRHASVYKTKLELLVCAKVADALRAEKGRFPVTEHGAVLLHIVPSSYCNAQADTIIFPKIALVRGVYTNDLLGIEDPHVVDVMKHLMGMATETGWSAHLPAWLDQL